MPRTTKQLIPLEVIERQICVVRGHRVMLDRDLASLFGVETHAVISAKGAFPAPPLKDKNQLT